jgi:hypothetical protein
MPLLLLLLQVYISQAWGEAKPQASSSSSSNGINSRSSTAANGNAVVCNSSSNSSSSSSSSSVQEHLCKLSIDEVKQQQQQHMEVTRHYKQHQGNPPSSTDSPSSTCATSLATATAPTAATAVPSRVAALAGATALSGAGQTSQQLQLVNVLTKFDRPPPTNVVNVYTNDGEWFPVKKKLLRPCIALTQVGDNVRALLGLQGNNKKNNLVK